MNGPPKDFVIGDIHGNLKGFKQCLYMSGFRPEIDWLITLGDVVDGGPQSAQVVELILSFPNTINVRGNHDRWCENYLFNGYAIPEWYEQGGKATIESYHETHFRYDQRHLDFFRRQCDYYVDDQTGRAYVHGGYTSELGLGHESSSSKYYWNRTLWHVALKERGELTRTNMYSDVFIGHTAVNRYSEFPVKCGNIWNLDTGAGWKGRVTIMNADTKMFWQSDPTPLLYPNHTQRERINKDKNGKNDKGFTESLGDKQILRGRSSVVTSTKRIFGR